jgi:hypothetical protein
MRRLLFILAAVGLIAGVTVVKIRASSPATPPTRQEAAQKLLATKAANLMTAPALAAIRMLASGNRTFGQDSALASSQQPATLGNAPARGAPPTAPGLGNVRVNNPGEDTHQSEQTTQSETSIAVSGKNVVVGFNDSQSTLLFLTPGTDLTGYAYSRNGGQTFTDGGVIPNASPATINFGDPWLASDATGTMYFSTLADDPFAGLLVGVAKSTDGGQSWSAPTLISPPPSAPNSHFLGDDKDSLSSSNLGLSATWDDFTFTVDPNTGDFQELSGLVLARSTDGGQTWTSKYIDQVPIVTFNPSAPPDCSFHQYIGAQSITGPDGSLYVASLRFDVTDPTCSGAPETESEYIARSTDGGATFGPVTKIADVTPSTGNSGAFVLGPAEFMRNLEFPTLAFLGSTLYVTWNDGGDGSGHSHIRLARSTDHGATWSTSFVTSGLNDEAQPAISSDASGLHIAYYEITGAGNGNALLDVMVSDSPNGTSFTPTRVTNQSFPGVLTLPNFDPIIAFAYMGDYIANVSDGTHQYFAWGDNRDTATDFLYPQGRHDPDVFFATR